MSSHAIAFDSYAYVRKLRDAGMDEAQAAIQAEALISLAEDRLATKQDVAELKRDMATIEANLKRDIALLDGKMDGKIETTKAELKRDIALVEANLKVEIKEIDAKIEAAKSDTLKWTAGMFAAQTALIIGAMFAVMKVNQPVAQPAMYQPPVQEMRQTAPAPSAPLALPPAPTR